MDYKKEYKNLVAKIKIAHSNAQTNSTKSVLEDILPALRESEDERIRKWIIEELEITRDAMSGKHPYSDDPDIVARLKRLDEAISYLEKQKDAFENGRQLGIMQEQARRELEWDEQKEQKPAEKQDYSGLNDSERAIHRGFLAAGVENVPVGIIKETTKECIANFPWPTKWSEEDENNLNKLLQWDGIPLGLRGWVSGLPKKVGTRPSWKPSEGQKEALKRAIDLLEGEYCDHPEELDSLLNDLNKL